MSPAGAPRDHWLDGLRGSVIGDDRPDWIRAVDDELRYGYPPRRLEDMIGPIDHSREHINPYNMLWVPLPQHDEK